MDTPRPTRPPAFDHMAVARWNHAIARSKREYYHNSLSNCYECGRYVRSDSGLCATCEKEEPR